MSFTICHCSPFAYCSSPMQNFTLECTVSRGRSKFNKKKCHLLRFSSVEKPLVQWYAAFQPSGEFQSFLEANLLKHASLPPLQGKFATKTGSGMKSFKQRWEEMRVKYPAELSSLSIPVAPFSFHFPYPQCVGREETEVKLVTQETKAESLKMCWGWKHSE